MKLYTEEQVRKAHQNGRHGGHNEIWYETDEYIDLLTPIELPSDEEILRVALKKTNGINEQVLFNNGAVYVCRLIEEQIKQQDNGK